MTTTFRIPAPLHNRLMSHLFPGDLDEHGAVITAGISRSARGTRLLARELVLARDGVDYVPGQHGYRCLTTDFVMRVSDHCDNENLCYFAVHNHRGDDRVAFSQDDLNSHQRGYPALLDILQGGPVGALVFARNAVAGHIWERSGVNELDEMVVIGPNHESLFSSPENRPVGTFDKRFHRQSLIFGPIGQQRLKNAKIGIIGLGGAGSLINEWLAKLGVGWIVAVDFDRVDLTNLPRLVGATRWDALEPFAASRRPFLQRIGKRFARHKVSVAKRVARRAQAGIRYEAIVGDITAEETALGMKDCDFVFLCADSAQSRLVFNALAHQYLIPGTQVGAKISVKKDTGAISDIFTASRPVLPYSGGGCLWCNQLISASRLQEEALSEDERLHYAYLDDAQVAAPSVITLNASAAAQAANDFLFSYLGLYEDLDGLPYVMQLCRERHWTTVGTSTEESCFNCSLTSTSQLARGDRGSLPCRES